MNSEFTAYQSSLQNWSTVLRPAEMNFIAARKTMLRSKNDSLQVPTYGVSHFHQPLKRKQKSSLMRLEFVKEPPMSITAMVPF